MYYDEMHYFFRLGFNICIYGIGSKWSFIKSFYETHLKVTRDLFLVINGFHPATIFKSILNKLTLEIKEKGDQEIENKRKFFSLKDQIDYTHEVLSSTQD